MRGRHAVTLDANLHQPMARIPRRRRLRGADPERLRAIVNETNDPPVVVTVYRTSKIDKYWSQR